MQMQMCILTYYYGDASSGADKFRRSKQNEKTFSQERRNELTLKVRQLDPSLPCDGRRACTESFTYQDEQSASLLPLGKWWLVGWLAVAKTFNSCAPATIIFVMAHMNFSFGQSCMQAASA
jgi:hypothetical protein